MRLRQFPGRYLPRVAPAGNRNSQATPWSGPTEAQHSGIVACRRGRLFRDRNQRVARAYCRSRDVADGPPDEHPPFGSVRPILRAPSAQEISHHRLRQRAPARLEENSSTRAVQLRPRQSAVCGEEGADRRTEGRHEFAFWLRERRGRSGLRFRLVCESRRFHSGNTDQGGFRLHELNHTRRAGRYLVE